MKTVTGAAPGRRVAQRRGQKTYDALIATGFALLAEREFEAITIAELAREAGYSVGAFYARFRSKDEFFDAMIAHHLQQRDRIRRRIFAMTSEDELIAELVRDLVAYYWKRRRFWRAALIRSIHDPGFWAPIRAHGHEYADALIARIERRARRPLVEAEQTNIRFAFQVLLGTINNSIINRPGPVFLGQADFVEHLTRAFRLILDFDRLMQPETSAAS